jgi:hypothetical protein
MAKLEEKDVRELLRAYEGEGVTDELYRFGSMLVQEVVERAHRLDAKASALAAYAGGIIVLLNLTSSIWKEAPSVWVRYTLLLAATGVFMAGACAVASLRVRTFDWFSDSEWIKDKYLGDADMLRRYHTLSMYNVHRSHEVVSGRKTAWLSFSVWIFACAGILLLASLIAAVWPHPLAALLNSLRVRGI